MEEKNNSNYLQSWASVVGGISTLMGVGYSLYVVSQWLVLLGYLLIIAIAMVTIGMLFAGGIWLIRYASKAKLVEIGQFGSVSRDLFGHTQIYAPMGMNTPKITKLKNKTTVTHVIPSLIELIDSGVISQGQLQMHMGFEQSKGGLIPMIDSWPGTFILAGMGRSGKTRRVLTIIIQAILGNARVFIIDPHATKRDGLAKLVEPLAPWLSIARGPEASMELARCFAAEMRYRVGHEFEGTGYWQPWVMVIDEWSAVMTDDTLEFSDEDRELLIDLITYCSTQYAGYAGYAGIIGQVWTNESCPTAIRRSAHKVFCHLLNSEYASFFFRGKWATKASELETRQCIYRSGPETKIITTLDVPDNTCEWVAAWLQEHMPPQELATVPDRVLLPAVSSLNNAETAQNETKHETFRRMRREKANQSTIIATIWGARPGENAAYRAALAEYKQLLEEEKQ